MSLKKGLTTQTVSVDGTENEEGENNEVPEIVNEDNEPKFQMVFSPEHLTFRYYPPNPGYDVITLTNSLEKKQAFKVKTNRNATYNAKPCVGFLDPAETIYIRVEYTGGYKKPDEMIHVAIYHTEAGDAAAYNDAFQVRTDGVVHLYCLHEAGPPEYRENQPFPPDDEENEEKSESKKGEERSEKRE
uniref:Major sperm protein n=1 Tax=Caenorhabditis japonica TaxID=281687 RepID=A0A8R1HKL0_CAEJA